MKVIVIPILLGAHGIVTKGLVQGLQDLEIRGWVETIQITALLRSATILRRVMETYGTGFHWDSWWKTSANLVVKNS